MSTYWTYYNEMDEQKAEWLKVLIEWGELSDGEIDTRDMREVRPEDIRGFRRAHFCAGVGLWDLALQRAGWPEDREVHTASLPCQPFSTAGKGRGTDDARHLWPCFFDLFRECRPVVCFGEQVINGDPARAWFDRVAADLESQGYAVGACGIPAAGFGAPHQRHRLYFVAHPSQECHGTGEQGRRREHTDGGGNGELADTPYSDGWEDEQERGPERRVADSRPGEGSDLGDTFGSGLEGHAGDERQPSKPGRPGAADPWQAVGAGSIPGAWDRVEWVLCRDPQRGLVWRPIEPEFAEMASGGAARLVRGSDRSTFPMVKGASARSLRIKGYGDGITVPVAEAFIRAYSAEVERRIQEG